MLPARRKLRFHSNTSGDAKSLEALFIEANKQQDARNFRAAFKLFESAAVRGHVYSMNSLGHAFDVGIGTRKDKNKAMFWYRKAARRGDLCAFTNIGTIYRDDKNFALARLWFMKALKKGDGDAALEIGKLYLRSKRELRQAEKYLRMVLDAGNVTESSKEEAKDILKGTKPPSRRG